ncbi:UNVERIFIED_ORG: transketolase [Xanthobacter viscosus]|uniref:Transketolase n=1 Tax=Xanthobacter autotrophicus TaxID=280 RepID=A0A6C1KE00_XANAU|nr:transketolase [Xanthobacter autotrophicus]TLX42382.1 transketolase [Xanthobacter autotrophicus]
MLSRTSHDRMANAIRFLAMDAVEAANSGHPGLPMGAADIATVLFTKVLKYDPTRPFWPDRDRFVLSAGHGSMLLYSVLHLAGYEKVTIEEIKRFRKLGSLTPGHPENFVTEGIETTTGPLGQGIATAVGMAMAERALAARFGKDVVDHHTFVLCSDGDLMEGISQEAADLAGHLKLSKLIVMWDDNGISIDGATSISGSTDQLARFAASGWATTRIDGHDPEAILAALTAAKASDRPTLIACRTVIGFGAPKKAGSEKVHGSPLGADEIAATRAALGWEAAPFEIPADVLAGWRAAGAAGSAARAAWEARLAAAPEADRAEFERRIAGTLPKALEGAIVAVKQKAVADGGAVATRKSSELVLDFITPVVPEMLGGSADLTGSNNTKAKGAKAITPDDFSGSFVHWGVREHGMAAAMNGITLHKGLIPFSGGFLVFSDYCRPSIRLAALMGERVIHVLTHDSIGLGEDGPTHQPVEHLAALRAIPNLLVMRPADTVETAECWQIALEAEGRPSALILSRQNLPILRTDATPENRSAGGAYEIVAASAKAQASLFATGSEVSLAVEAAKLLEAQGVPTRVVSIPSFELFLERPAAERAKVIGDAPAKVAVEAAIRMGWDAIVGSDAAFVGMTSFGASAPGKDLFAHFGLTPDKVAAKALDQLRQV